MRNPMEAPCPPDHAIERFTITFDYDNENLTWHAHCPEWQCDIYRSTATEAAKAITDDIDDHNDKDAEAILDELIDKNPGALVNAIGALIRDGKLKT